MSLVLFVILSCHGAAAQAASWRYSVNVKPLPGDSYAHIVTLRDTRRKRTVWRRQVDGKTVVWSQDRRALAVLGILNILVWREGYRLRNFGVPGGYDYTMGAVWSPDARRLLVGCGLSGMVDVDIRTVYSYRFGPGRKYRVTKLAGNIRIMKWRDNRTALLWDIVENSPTLETRPKPWVRRVP